MQTMRLVADVARCRSFSKAAALHGITQSAASQRVGQLERRLGVELFDRSTRPLTLTDAGRVFQTGAMDILQRAERLEQQVVAVGQRGRDWSQVDGSVRVHAIYSAGIDFLSGVLDQLRQRSPRLRVDLTYENPGSVRDAVLAGRSDVGIVSYPSRCRGVRWLALRDEPMGVVARPDHPLVQSERVRATSLAGHVMLGFDPALPVARATLRYVRSHGVSPNVDHTFDNLDTLKGAVAVTDRYAILPLRTVGREVQAGTLARAVLEPGLVRPMGIIYRRGQDAGPEGFGGMRGGVQAVVDTLLELAGPGEEPGDGGPAGSGGDGAQTSSGLAASAGKQE
jgi:DNA-binding transcriptional LysR family regulator